MDKKELLKKLGKNIKIARIKRDLTQEQLAERLGVGRNHVGGMEIGMYNMSMGKILELANALEADINELLEF